MISTMADLLIRNVPAQTLAAIKERAKRRGLSVQAEALATLERGAQPTGIGLVAWLKPVRPKAPASEIDAAVEAATAAIRADHER